MQPDATPTPAPPLVRDYDFALPEALIAQQPASDRAGSRMLTVDRSTGALADRSFADLVELLHPGDLLVLNNSRVFPARLYGQRAGGAGRVEVLLTEQVEPWRWRALVRPGRKVLVGTQLVFPDASGILLRAEVEEHGSFGERILRFTPVDDFFEVVERIGRMPLPPYIRRDPGQRTVEDRERYQTVYAEQRGSAAAPTAGLHFTDAILAALRARGVEIAALTLHVGLGTFQPVRVDRVEDIRLHREHYTLPAQAADAVNRAHAEGRRIVAVGTTTVRTLEHCAREAQGAPLVPHTGATALFISPGFHFALVNAMLTNFHLPQSSLLMLVCAFAGHAPVLEAYRHAVAGQYRFFSFGDCMFLS